jgi:hypothetical protein
MVKFNRPTLTAVKTKKIQLPRPDGPKELLRILALLTRKQAEVGAKAGLSLRSYGWASRF